jgi:hypothetical protein
MTYGFLVNGILDADQLIKGMRLLITERWPRIGSRLAKCDKVGTACYAHSMADPS